MRYITSLDSQWFQKYEPSKLKKRKNLRFPYLNGLFFLVFNFDGLYFWNHLEIRDVMYLIWKVVSVLKWSLKIKGVVALLLYATANRKRPFYTLKWQKVRLFCTGLYANCGSMFSFFAELPYNTSAVASKSSLLSIWSLKNKTMGLEFVSLVTYANFGSRFCFFA